VRAFITGATGFLGVPLVRTLLEEGFEVAALVRRGTEHAGRLPKHPALRAVEGELDDVTSWLEQLSGFGGDLFFHLAWKDVRSGERNDLVQMMSIVPTVETVRLAKLLDAGAG